MTGEANREKDLGRDKRQIYIGSITNGLCQQHPIKIRNTMTGDSHRQVERRMIRPIYFYPPKSHITTSRHSQAMPPHALISTLTDGSRLSLHTPFATAINGTIDPECVRHLSSIATTKRLNLLDQISPLKLRSASRYVWTLPLDFGTRSVTYIYFKTFRSFERGFLSPSTLVSSRHVWYGAIGPLQDSFGHTRLLYKNTVHR